jgi:hypothetical protein
MMAVRVCAITGITHRSKPSSYSITSSGYPIGELLAEMRTRFAKPLLATPQQLDSQAALSHSL